MDGGLDIPHSEKRFVGYDTEAKQLDAEVLKAHIYGSHVAEYMNQLKEDDPDKYQSQFSKYIAAGVEADDLETIYQTAHQKIRADPSSKKASKKAAPAGGWPAYRTLKMTHAEKKEALEKRIATLMEMEED